MSSLKESDEYLEFQDIYRKMKDYVLNGGLKNYLVGTKNELMETSHNISLFEGTTFLLEAIALVPDLEITPHTYRGLVGLDLTLRLIRMFEEGNEHVGPGLIGSGREFLGYLLENRNRKK